MATTQHESAYDLDHDVNPPSSRAAGETAEYLPIEHYGIIGDMRTVAMVGVNGSIDWFCYPRFDSPSVFGRILDAEKGGFFQIAPVNGDYRWRQNYWPDTNVLVTRFFLESGMAEVVDFMPVGTDANDDISDEHCIVRHVQVIRGTVQLQLRCQPALDYARAGHTVEIVDDGAIFTGLDSAAGQRFRLCSSVPVHQTGNGVGAAFTLSAGEVAAFAFQGTESSGNLPDGLNAEHSAQAFRQTVTWWRGWLSSCTYRGRWREHVYRSALTMKLLTSSDTGAIVAAPTTSLPEEIGGERNWDYRYSWLRDAAFVIYAFLRLGFRAEATQFLQWLSERARPDGRSGPLRPMYRVDGSELLNEETLDNLSGYRDSRPVRIGNAAEEQLQLDIYGEVLDAVYLANKYVEPISWELWELLREMVDWVVDNWERPDDGMWEARDGRQQNTIGKVMCWVAIDRALRIASKRSFPAPRDRWMKARDEIYETVMKRAWNPRLQAFTGRFDSDHLDAATLLMPLVFFVSPRDPRMVSTLDAILKPPSEGGLTMAAMVYRYLPGVVPDGLNGTEGTFSMCTFWLVETLTRAGRLDEARLLFERMLGLANHLGLYSEEVGSRGEALGNMPQAFTHFALISAAVNLDKAMLGNAERAWV